MAFQPTKLLGRIIVLRRKEDVELTPHGNWNRVRFDSTLNLQNSRSKNPWQIVRCTASNYNTAARLKTLSQPIGNDNKVENQALTGNQTTVAHGKALSQPYGNDFEIATHKLTGGDPTSASWNARGQPNGNDSVNATQALTEKPQLIPPFPE